MTSAVRFITLVSQVALKSTLLVVALIWLAGCVQVKPAPGYARAGDYIVLGLGGVARNSGGAAALDANDLTITLTDANAVDHSLEARYVFKSYVDYSAWMNASALEGSTITLGLTDMVPFDGGWFAVVPLTYPGQFESPLPLAVGEATVSVTSPKLTNIGNLIEGDLTVIPIEIIAGVSPHDNDYQRQFLGYSDNERNFVIAPDDLSGVSEVGGLYLQIDYTDDSFFAPGVEPMVVPSDHHPFVQLNYNHVSNGDGTGTLYVTLLNSAGFKTMANATQNSALLSSLTVKLLYFSNFSDARVTEAKASFSINTAASYYIDTDGAQLSGVTPVLTHIDDL